MTWNCSQRRELRRRVEKKRKSMRQVHQEQRRAGAERREKKQGAEYKCCIKVPAKCSSRCKVRWVTQRTREVERRLPQSLAIDLAWPWPVLCPRVPPRPLQHKFYCATKANNPQSEILLFFFSSSLLSRSLCWCCSFFSSSLLFSSLARSHIALVSRDKIRKSHRPRRWNIFSSSPHIHCKWSSSTFRRKHLSIKVTFSLSLFLSRSPSLPLIADS